MRINPSILKEVMSKYDKSIDTKKSSVGKSSSNLSDEVEFSSDAKFFIKAVKIAKDVDDIMAKRISQLRESIANGTYELKDAEVAEKIIADARANKNKFGE